MVTDTPPQTRGRALAGVRTLAPGVGVALAALGLAWALHHLLPAVPTMTLAVLLGLLAANLPGTATACAGVWRPGLDAAGKHLMRCGIVLLGLRLSFGDVLGLGWRSVGLIVAVVVLSFAGTYLLGKAFRLAGDAPLLIAAGFSICGASAIGAVAAVKRTRPRDTVLPVALVTLCGTLSIAVLPFLSGPLGLDELTFGRWVGAGVHDVGQVVAAAQTAGTVALGAAIVVKLTRVMLLAPLTALVGLSERRRLRRLSGPHPDHAPRFPPLVPLFVIGFLACSLLRSSGVLPEAVLTVAAAAQDLALGAALFGLGSAIRVADLRRTGARAAGMGLCAWVLISVLAWGAVRLM